MEIPIASQNINFPGYGMFWVANSISSTLIGLNTRRLQEKAHEKNREFQLEMARARHITSDERFQEEIAFKRRLMAVSRDYRQEQTRITFNEQMNGVELRHYLQYCWPLDSQLPYVLLEELSKKSSEEPLLNVILMHAPLLPLQPCGSDANLLDAEIYKELEYSIKQNDIPLIGHVNYRKDACVKPDMMGGNASIMNIHFLMRPMPTLVVAPQYRDGRMYFTGAVWEPQEARPFIRPLVDFDFNPVQAENDESYRQQMIDVFHTTASVIIGSVRDSYMLLTQGKAPTLPALINDKEHKYMKDIVASEPNLQKFVRQENKNILESLDEKNTPQLLDVFNKEDVEAIKEQVESNGL